MLLLRNTGFVLALLLAVVVLLFPTVAYGETFETALHDCTTEEFCRQSDIGDPADGPGCRSSGLSLLCREDFVQCVPAQEPKHSIKHHSRDQYKWLNQVKIHFRINSTVASHEDILTIVRLRAQKKIGVSLFSDPTRDNLFVDVFVNDQEVLGHFVSIGEGSYGVSREELQLCFQTRALM
eukprot:6841457-Pyramimonas_sp.AAC.1